MARLNTFQLQGLRQILKMVTTYINRDNTNTKVLEEADKAINTDRRNGIKKVELLSEIHTNQRVKWAGKVLRRADTDPRRFSTYMAGTAKVIKKGLKRVGRPRSNWGDETHSRAWTMIQEQLQLGDNIGDPTDTEQQDWVRDAATMGII